MARGFRRFWAKFLGEFIVRRFFAVKFLALQFFGSAVFYGTAVMLIIFQRSVWPRTVTAFK